MRQPIRDHQNHRRSWIALLAEALLGAQVGAMDLRVVREALGDDVKGAPTVASIRLSVTLIS
jgi:hypothetical protein